MNHNTARLAPGAKPAVLHQPKLQYYAVWPSVPHGSHDRLVIEKAALRDGCWGGTMSYPQENYLISMRCKRLGIF
jgi:hypothetical protein